MSNLNEERELPVNSSTQVEERANDINSVPNKRTDSLSKGYMLERFKEAGLLINEDKLKADALMPKIYNDNWLTGVKVGNFEYLPNEKEFHTLHRQARWLPSFEEYTKITNAEKGNLFIEIADVNVFYNVYQGENRFPLKELGLLGEPFENHQPGVCAVVGAPGQGKSTFCKAVMNALNVNSIYYLAEPEITAAASLSEIKTLMTKAFSSDDPVIIFDSFKWASAFGKQVLLPGGISRNIFEYATFLDIAAKRMNKLIIAVVTSEVSDATQVYFERLKGAVESVIIPDVDSRQIIGSFRHRTRHTETFECNLFNDYISNMGYKQKADQEEVDATSQLFKTQASRGHLLELEMLVKKALEADNK